MYKKLNLNANIKPDIDENIWEVLEWMSTGDNKIYPDIEHPLFDCPDIHNLFLKQYLPKSLNKDPMVYRHLNTCYIEFDLEDDYEVVEKFLDWISPYVDKLVFGALITDASPFAQELKHKNDKIVVVSNDEYEGLISESYLEIF